jgi:hypothetical protein
VRSARLLGAEEAFRRKGRVPFRIAPAERHDTVLAGLRQRMEPAALVSAWREGLAMGREDVLAYALAEPARGRDGDR